MSETASNVIRYTPLESGDGESRWLRLEQVETGNAHLTVAEAAELIDNLFDLEPCDDGMGGGGAEADEGNDPDEGKFDSKMAELLEKAGLCRQQGHWTADVDVLRSHKVPENYELRGDYVLDASVKIMRESKRQIVDASGATIELEWPYDGGLTGIPEGVRWEVRGSTVNLDRPVHGRLLLRYNTRYDRVSLNINFMTVEEKTIDDMIRMLAVPGSSDKALSDGRPTAAAVTAFWGDLAATCELEPPEENPNTPGINPDEACKKDDDDDPEHNLEEGDCWKTIKHYKVCDCSYTIIDEWEEEVSAPCDGASSGAYVGYEENFQGFRNCPEETDDDLRDPQFYRDHCCKDPPSPWHPPRCRTEYREYKGGHAIDSGPEYWKNIYGSDVRLIPVVPEGGRCGDTITYWNVPQKNCCEGVEPLEPDPSNPTNIEPGRSYIVGVLHGKQGAELTWTAQGGIRFSENGETTYKTSSRGVRIKADDDICPSPVITVDDGCNSLTMTFEGTATEGPSLPDDMTVGKNQLFSVDASGGVRPYMWQAGGGLILVGTNPSGTRAHFRTPDDDEWCGGDVTVVDQCGRDATMTVYGPAGRWVELEEGDPDFDWCEPPGAPFKREDPSNLNNRRSLPHNGYKIVYREWQNVVSKAGAECAPGAQWPCGLGNNVMADFDLRTRTPSNCENEGATVRIYTTGCCRTYNSRYFTEPQQATSYMIAVQRLYKWVCG